MFSGQSRGEVNSFLEYGYVPRSTPGSVFETVVEAAARDDIDGSEAALIREGNRVLDLVFNDLLSKCEESATHIVPLSGGFDSRTILGALLSRIDPSRIHTVTFGIPGTWDFEYGRRIARTAGVSHDEINLSSMVFNWSPTQVTTWANTYDRKPTRMLEAYVHDWVQAEYISPGNIYWSGFPGEAVAGENLPNDESQTWERAVDRFIGFRQFTDLDLTDDGYDTTAVLPERPFVDKEILSYDQQLEFGVRQEYFTRPIVNPGPATKPYLHPEWLNFIVNVPREYRVGRDLFKKIVQDRYPDLFSIPTDHTFGLPITASQNRIRDRQETLDQLAAELTTFVHPVTNYLEFGTSFRHAGPLRTLAENQLRILERREVVPWIQTREIWERHQDGEDLGAEIRSLLSLELLHKSRSDE